MSKQELIELIGDVMWPTDPWRDFSANIRNATEIAEFLIKKLNLKIKEN